MELSKSGLSKHLFSYKNVVKDNQIDLILYVASAEERPDLKLFKALQKAKLDSKDEKARSKLELLKNRTSVTNVILKQTLDCPILLTMTKFDLLPASEQEELKQNIFFYHPESYALYDNGEFCPDVSLPHETPAVHGTMFEKYFLGE